jgi:glycosyltransferase involved in cell wall biosynthesis
LPCFNHARFLPEAVNSVLNQTHSDLELIIIDDCSTDNSPDVERSFARTDSRVRVFNHTVNKGLSSSRNSGLRVATGDFIAFCDSDDVWEPDKLKQQLAVLQVKPKYDIAYCDTLIIDENGSLTGKRFSDRYPLPNQPSGRLFPELMFRNFINVQSALMRKCCLNSVSSFDGDLKALEDWWYWIQLSRNHLFIYMPESLARYRVHSNSMHATMKRSFPESRVKIFERMLQRYDDLAGQTKADMKYQMATDLLALGEYPSARRLLLQAIKLSTKHPRGFSRSSKAAARFLLSVTAFRNRPPVRS